MTQVIEPTAHVHTDLYVDGAPVPAERTLRVADPADPSATVGYAAAATRSQALDAVGAADRAFPAWAARSAGERADLLRAAITGLAEHRGADAEILTRENGKILQESTIDLIVFDHRVELACAGVDQVGATSTLAGPPYDTQVGYVPLGVVTIIVPFNWPLAILAASLPQALLAGNTVVVKPPPSAPLATTRVVQRMAAALPPGVLNVVTGEDAEIGTALVSDERVAKVCFTGSPAGGRRIMAMAAETLTRVALELGGNDPALVLDDAVLDDAALDRLVAGTFDSTGQICMAIKRLYVHRSRYAEVVEGMSARLAGQVLGHGLDPATTMGPLHTARQRDFVADLVAQARAAGAEVREFGSGPDDRFTDGHFLRPSLVLDPARDARVVTEEQFGPTLPILPFDTDDEAVAAANDTWAGLCSSVWTPDRDRAARVAARLRSGYTFVDAHGAPWLDERAPFGGLKGSGMGREMGVEGLREFMDTHSVAFPSG
ncbi:aldehyde dehydrogenase family protein [Pseudonocardia xinjiangensis]|uniref:aldehyde dehydrogenase family protein n=1 Tax=Pseudonocardia xinjiangensis TaxID=75289 RepID=UPI003D8E76A0